jgi:hypothetical protein
MVICDVDFAASAAGLSSPEFARTLERAEQ